MKKIVYPLLLVSCAGLFACSSPQKTAPISDRSSITTSNPYQPIDRNTIRYTVKRGDTLSQIARRSGHSVHDLAGWNNLANVNALEVGQVLRVQKGLLRRRLLLLLLLFRSVRSMKPKRNPARKL